MALTLGIGPLARPSGGRINGDLWSGLPGHAVFTHPVHKRLRARFGGMTVLETTAAVMLHETGLLPVYYLPFADLAPGVLKPSETVTTCPFKGVARYHHLMVGDRIAQDAVWSYPEPIEGMEVLADLCSLRFEVPDQWWEEDEPVHGHPRDPFHRVDCRPSGRHVLVRRGDTVLAESRRSVALFETGLPPRFYVPVESVRVALSPSKTRTFCPYKGEATYVSVDGVEDAAWRYAEPYDEARAVAGRYCFAGPGITTLVDGSAVE
ncbi:DUF427 domain-containing protein [Speluncibacter jeojiensis]|uniref:DUF427 domain-containing protein n=1 Tax=Speluncibacter jeojiensis TaxID=2710754 RepID=A0A9X4RHP3_9ACTN|nr:DUF427 domain-containing protein [Corynebacteriales bacterium D3-21]